MLFFVPEPAIAKEKGKTVIGKKRYVVCFKVDDKHRERELRKKLCEFGSPQALIIGRQVFAITSDLDAKRIYEKLFDGLCEADKLFVFRLYDPDCFPVNAELHNFLVNGH